MLKHYFKIALRNIFKYKAYTIISAVCIALGLLIISSWLLLFSYGTNTFINWDNNVKLNFLQDFNYKIDAKNLDGIKLHLGDIGKNMKVTSNKDINNDVAFVKDDNNPQLFIASYIRVNKEYFNNENVSFLYGARDIQSPDEVIISKSFAEKIGLGKDIIGCSIIFNYHSAQIEYYKIVNVINDSEISDKDDIYLPISNDNQQLNLYLELKKGQTIEMLNQQLKNIKFESNGEVLYCYVSKQGPENYYFVYVLTLFFAGILLSALITLLKYSFQIFYSRQRELVLRKLFGSKIKGLFMLFFTEILSVVVFAYFLSLIIAEFIISLFPLINEDKLVLDLIVNGLSISKVLCANSILIFIVLIICAIITYFQVNKVYKSSENKLNFSKVGHIKRLILIGLQLSFSIFLLGMSLVEIFPQIQKNNGLYSPLKNSETERILNISSNSKSFLLNKEAIYTEIKNIPQIVENVCFGNMENVYVSNEDGDINVSVLRGSVNYFKFFNIPLSGKSLEVEKPGYIYISEAFSKFLQAEKNNGFVEINGKNYQIAGVYKSLYKDKNDASSAFLPYTNRINMQSYFKLSARADIDEIKDKMIGVCNKYVGDKIPLKVATLDELNADMGNYFELLMAFLTIVSLVIVVLSVYTSISMEARNRQKEMAVRKINGANKWNIAGLFVRSYFIVFVISFLAMYILLVYLYEADIMRGWRYVVVLFSIISGLLILTTYWQVKKIMNVNPAEVLRKE
jgi:Predicted permease.